MQSNCRSIKFPFIISVLLVSSGIRSAEYPTLSINQIEWLGEQIFTNECNRDFACLTAWNQGENFPSLGIGHFIWYQAGQEEIFTESFPDLLQFMQGQGIEIPAWIEAENRTSPWPDREAFQADLNSTRMQELRLFLQNHTREQTAFIIQRFDSALETITNNVNDREAVEQIRNNFHRVANSNPPYGLYALIDYVNFKGTGISADEMYQGKGWGLKQVLLGMDSNQDALEAFIDSASAVLHSRVENAPPERNEERWLVGWTNRLETYREHEQPGE